MNKAIPLLLALLLPTLTFAGDFTEKPIKGFAQLDRFASVSQFEKHINAYEQKCLDNSYGGSLAVRCFVAYKLWDRELNKYYRLLYRRLDKQGKAELKASQVSWLKTRDATIRFNNHLLDKQYDRPGTMYIAERAGDASDTIAPIVKHRALLLRKWYRSLKPD